jgi:hypothetical protein
VGYNGDVISRTFGCCAERSDRREPAPTSQCCKTKHLLQPLTFTSTGTRRYVVAHWVDSVYRDELQARPMSSKPVPAAPLTTHHTAEEQAACKHPDWKIVNTSGPCADGIGECKTFDGRCKTCDKLLVQRFECISADWCDVKDEEWAARPDVKRMLQD